MFVRLREYWQDYKAWRRGEIRVAPYGTRGRIYAKKGEEPPLQVQTQTTYKLLARVIRADGRADEYYELSEHNKLLTKDDYDTMRKGKPNG